MRHTLAATIVLLSVSLSPADDLSRYDAKIKAEDREHWAFQPVKKPEVPSVKNAAWCRNPIDRFVLAPLEEKGWTPSPSPSPLALLRRVHFDLIGLPPTPEEQEAFLRDPSSESLDRVVDELLARPSYGERWGRHWLDLVRFAETNGYERDATKPSAWKYRDWVIRSFNEDKPYDRFLVEQIAGDELPDADANTMIATGYNRLGPWDDEPADPKQDRYDQLDDVVSTTSEVVMGLTLGCARCHNHKFEPLTLLDYTRLVAVFDPLQRPTSGRTELDLPTGRQEQIRALADRDRQIDEHARSIRDVRSRSRAMFLKSPAFPLSAEVSHAFLTPPDRRSERQKLFVFAFEKSVEAGSSAWLSDEDRSEIRENEGRIRELRRRVPDLPRGYFLQESSANPPETHLLVRGQASNPGPAVSPGVPAVLVTSQPEFLPPDGRTTRRRLTLAKWLTRPDHPLTARVIVNRVWQFHCGDGLVRTPSDFGVMGDPPTHPELLDWLADWFVNEAHWSFKKLHRLILTSNTARMGKLRRADYAEEDSENRLLWRLPYRRLEVEAIRDAMLTASGQLNPAMYGPSVYPEVPKGALEGQSDPDKVWKPFDAREASRRTIYAFVKRSMIVPMIDVLDFCDTARSTARRTSTVTAPQALALFNGDFVNHQAAHFARRLTRNAGEDPARQVDLAYRLAIGRPATPGEISAMTAYLEREGGSGKALERMCRVIFNMSEFVYTD